MDFLLYSEINIFCTAILLIILVHCLTSPQKTTENKFFISAVSFSVLTTVFDTARTCIYQYDDLKFSHLAGTITSALCLICFITAVFFCFLYMEKAQDSILMKGRYRKATIAVSSALLCIFILFTLIYEICSYVSGRPDTDHGFSFCVQLSIAFIYIIIPAFGAALKAFKEKHFADKDKLISICSFALYPVSCILFHHIINVSVIAIPMFTLSYLFVFIETERRMISVDPVTGLDNRRRIVDYLSAKKKALDYDEKLCFIITDIDSFKNINDSYGHNEGDNALLIISSVLKDFCRKNDCFCGRYGGDEFVIIKVMNINESVLPLLDGIKDQVYKKCRSRGLEYRIELSFGCSEYSVGCVSGIPEIIQRADLDMYLDKQNKAKEFSVSGA